MNNLFFKIVLLKSYLTLKITICQVQSYMIPFLKQAKHKLKKSHSKDVFEFLWNLKRSVLGQSIYH